MYKQSGDFCRTQLLSSGFFSLHAMKQSIGIFSSSRTRRIPASQTAVNENDNDTPLGMRVFAASSARTQNAQTHNNKIKPTHNPVCVCVCRLFAEQDARSQGNIITPHCTIAVRDMFCGRLSVLLFSKCLYPFIRTQTQL